MEYKRLKDIANITMGQSPDSSSYNNEKDGLPFFQGNADFGELYPKERFWCNAPKKVAMPGDILISVRAPIGALNYSKGKSCIGRGLAAITIENIVERNYIFHLLKARNNYLNSMGTGSTFKAIGKNVLEEILIPQISREEQQKCVNMMDLLGSIIRERQSQLGKFDDIIKARFVEMFGYPSINNKRWQMGVINEIGSCIAGATPSTKVDEYWNNGTIPWMSSGEVNKGRVDRTDNFITHLGYDKTSTKLVPPKTVVLAMAGQGKTRGMAAITEIELCTNQSICSIVNNEKVDAEYLLYFLKLQYNELRRASTNTDGRGGLNLKIIGNYPIMIPPVALQKYFATFVTKVNKSKIVLQRLRSFTMIMTWE